MNLDKDTATEIIRENLTSYQSLQIWMEEREKGNKCSINRIHSNLVEITITRPAAIDVTPRRKSRGVDGTTPLLQSV